MYLHHVSSASGAGNVESSSAIRDTALDRSSGFSVAAAFACQLPSTLEDRLDPTDIIACVSVLKHSLWNPDGTADVTPTSTNSALESPGLDWTHFTLHRLLEPLRAIFVRGARHAVEVSLRDRIDAVAILVNRYITSVTTWFDKTTRKTTIEPSYRHFVTIFTLQSMLL